MKLNAEFPSKEIVITGTRKHSVTLHEIPILDKKRNIYLTKLNIQHAPYVTRSSSITPNVLEHSCVYKYVP
jgi:hypothetical protein